MVRVAGSQCEGEKVCVEIRITGTVQGVGFRPYLYNLAAACGLKGWVCNGSDGVLLELEGEHTKVESFCRRLHADPPKLAVIEQVKSRPLPWRGYDTLEIVFSRADSEARTFVPPDAAACPECMQEVRDPDDRHYQYPFTNCTHCGPRFTIINGVPYDRKQTTMAGFTPCRRCRAEYDDPAHRRFHAQPVACPDCGPQMSVLDGQGRVIKVKKGWLNFFFQKICHGKIFAVKGLGGYHLACLLDEAVVAELRHRKKRPHKPFAVMCANLETVERLCHLTPEEAELLKTPAAPIVLLPLKNGALIPRNVSPGLGALGVMLPYTPLHHLLLKGPFSAMVLTSANPTDLPILKDDKEAVSGLRGIADYFLVHDRPIEQRCDDSVVRVEAGGLQFHRRSRGYVPKPVPLAFTADEVALGAGGEMKSTFCLISGRQAIMSQHLGEMGTLESARFYRESLNHFLRFFNLEPQVIGYDAHPGFLISAWARELPEVIKVPVQHHHAHFASCLAENGHPGKAAGVILDGTGYGSDGAIWGFEIISGNFADFNRKYHQRYIHLPGGEAGIRWPWRMALSYLCSSMGERALTAAAGLFPEVAAWELKAVAREISTPLRRLPTSSCGRLFDAVSALLGVCRENTYEGQAAIELSELVAGDTGNNDLDPYPYRLEKNEVDFLPVFPALLRDIKKGRDKQLMARRFHDTIVEAVTTAVLSVCQREKTDTVALSGGTWHNVYLLNRVTGTLKEHGLNVLTHRHVPTNDGGLSLGQAAVAYWRWKESVPGYTNESYENREPV
jgi:hydrogenase maturation protein HypF